MWLVTVQTTEGRAKKLDFDWQSEHGLRKWQLDVYRMYLSTASRMEVCCVNKPSAHPDDWQLGSEEVQSCLFSQVFNNVNPWLSWLGFNESDGNSFQSWWNSTDNNTNVNTFLHIEHLCHGAVVLAELCQQAGGDGQQIAARQSFDLARVSEGGAHHHGGVAELLVVVVNLCHAHHACGKGRWMGVKTSN